MVETDKFDKQVTDYIREKVIAGFYDKEGIIESARDYFSEELGNAPRLREHIKTVTFAIIKAHLAQQAHWPEVTDCDRLDAAFCDLETKGIIARQNFTCCGTCGKAEIETVMMDCPSEGREIQGYVFYHQQDTENAARGHGVYLNYGAREEGGDATLAVAANIVTALHEHGLKTRWDGNWGKRIFVHMLWQRRWRLANAVDRPAIS